MNNVQLKIQELERRTRQALILQEERAQKVGKMFWDAQQAERYPNLSQNLALPTSNDTTLAIDGTEESHPYDIFNDIKDKLLVMTSNSKEITRYILSRINNIEVLSYLKEHWDELKAYLRPMSKSLFNREKLAQQILKFLKLNKVIEKDSDAFDNSNLNGSSSGWDSNYNPNESSYYDEPSYNEEPSYAEQTAETNFLRDDIIRMSEILKIPYEDLDKMLPQNGKNLFEQDVVEYLKELHQAMKKEVEDMNAQQQEIQDPSYTDLSYNDPYADFTYFPQDEETFTTPIKNEKDIEKETKSATLNKELDKRREEQENAFQNAPVTKIMTKIDIEKQKIKDYNNERKSLFENGPLNEAIKATFNGRTYSKLSSLKDLRLLQQFLENYEGVRVIPIGGSLKTYKSRAINFVKAKSKKKFYGRGFTQTNLSPKLFVDLEHLKGNKLTVKYRSTQKIQSSQQIPNEELKQVIIDLIIGKYDDKRYNKLSKENKAFIDSFITNAKVTFEPIQSEEQKLKTKWDILCGERQAGNDNPEITKMLLNVASRLYELKSITKNKYLQIKNELVGFSPL